MLKNNLLTFLSHEELDWGLSGTLYRFGIVNRKKNVNKPNLNLFLFTVIYSSPGTHIFCHLCTQSEFKMIAFGCTHIYNKCTYI